MSEESVKILAKVLKSRELFATQEFWKGADEKYVRKAKTFLGTVDRYVRDLTFCIRRGFLNKSNAAMICVFVSKDRMARAREIKLPFKTRNIIESYARNSLNYVAEINKNNFFTQ